METKSSIRGQEGFILVSNVFDLGNTRKKIIPPTTKSGLFSADGKKVSPEYFKLAIFCEDQTTRLHISLRGSHLADNCISNKLVKASSTIEFHPMGGAPVIYLYIKYVKKDEETGEITYDVTQGNRTMGDRHIKVFQVNT